MMRLLARYVMRSLMVLLWGCAQYSAAAGADLVDSLNVARAQGCGGMPGLAEPLTRVAHLDAAAENLRQHKNLAQSLRAAGYRAARSTAVSLGNVHSDEAVAKVVVGRYCALLVNPEYREIGLHRQAGGVLLILAAPFEVPGANAPDLLNQRVLELVNEARASSRDCGGRQLAPTHPLMRNALLDRAAASHAENMAAQNFFNHVGQDGSQPRERVERAGYRWRRVGENIAAGARTPEAVVDGWLKSPGHCVNIMSPDFSEMGISFAVNQHSRFGIYWAQLFGTQR